MFDINTEVHKYQWKLYMWKPYNRRGIHFISQEGVRYIIIESIFIWDNIRYKCTMMHTKGYQWFFHTTSLTVFLVGRKSHPRFLPPFPQTHLSASYLVQEVLYSTFYHHIKASSTLTQLPNFVSSFPAKQLKDPVLEKTSHPPQDTPLIFTHHPSGEMSRGSSPRLSIPSAPSSLHSRKPI